MKVALTGASGFLGPSLVRLLLERGHGVHVLARDVKRALEAGYRFRHPEVAGALRSLVG
jgi:uncharacterized protein YbjT (DUF2867 family)